MNEKMTPLISVKLRTLSFFAIVMVIYIHTFYTEGESLPILNTIETLIGGRLCMIAVPMFYAISGYLFFLKMPCGIRSIGGKLKKRVRTLLVPYIIANVLTFCFYIALNFISILSSTVNSVVNFKVFSIIKQGLCPTLELLFVNPPIAFQMWFIRDLMLVMLFSPIIYLVLKVFCKINFHFIAILLFLALYVTVDNHLITAITWFAMGGILCMQSNINIGRHFPSVYGISTVTILISLIVFTTYFKEIPTWVTRMIPVVGVPAMWLCFDIIIKHKNTVNSWIDRKIYPYTFFIYMTHEPLLNIFKKLPLLIAQNQCVFIICYLLIPILYVVLACIAGQWLSKHFHYCYSIYTGGR